MLHMPDYKQMADKQSKPRIQRCATTDSVTEEEHGPVKVDSDRRIRKSVSMDSGEADIVKNSLNLSSGNGKRRTIRRRAIKRLGKQEPEFGHDTDMYEKIRERVLQERAVTNAIDALQERWRMLLFMYNDCVELNEKRRERKLCNLCVRRQFELIFVVCAFMLLCLPVSVVFVLISR